MTVELLGVSDRAAVVRLGDRSYNLAPGDTLTLTSGNIPGMATETVASHHFLRRTARARAAELNRAARRRAAAGVGRAAHYRVESLVRGPFGWKVVRA